MGAATISFRANAGKRYKTSHKISQTMVVLASVVAPQSSLKVGNPETTTTLPSVPMPMRARMPTKFAFGGDYGAGGGSAGGGDEGGMSIVRQEMQSLVYKNQGPRSGLSEWAMPMKKPRNWRNPGRREEHHFRGTSITVRTPPHAATRDARNPDAPYVISQVFPPIAPRTASHSHQPRKSSVEPAEAAEPAYKRQLRDEEPVTEHSAAFDAAEEVVPAAPAAAQKKSKPSRSVFDDQVAHYHKLLRSKMATRFSTLRRVFRKIDADASGQCDRGELKYMLNAMFNLRVPDAVMERMIDLADHDGDGNIRFDEFARVFTADDIFNMKNTLSAVDVAKYGTAEVEDERAPLDPRSPTHQVRRHHSHFPPGEFVATNDAVFLAQEAARFIPRVLTSSHGRGFDHSSPPRTTFKPLNLRDRAASHTMLAAGRSTGCRVPFTLEWPLHLEDNKEHKEAFTKA